MTQRRALYVIAAVILVGIAVGVTATASFGETVLVVEDDGGEILTAEADDGTTASLEYVHSVEKTPVRDVYVVEDGGIRFDRTEFVSFGAGLPTEDIERNEEGAYVHEPNDSQVKDEVVVSTGEIAGHELVVNDERYDLAGPTDGGTVRIYVTRTIP